MLIEQAIPLLVGVLVGILLSVIVWSVVKARRHPPNETPLDFQAQVLLWLLLIAVFSTGVLVTYLLFRL